MNRNMSESRDKLQYFAMLLILLNGKTTVTPKNKRAQKVKSWPHRAVCVSVSVTTDARSVLVNGHDADAWCGLCRYKSMWAITSINAVARCD